MNHSLTSLWLCGRHGFEVTPQRLKYCIMRFLEFNTLWLTSFRINNIVKCSLKLISLLGFLRPSSFGHNKTAIINTLNLNIPSTFWKWASQCQFVTKIYCLIIAAITVEVPYIWYNLMNSLGQNKTLCPSLGNDSWIRIFDVRDCFSQF